MRMLVFGVRIICCLEGVLVSLGAGSKSECLCEQAVVGRTGSATSQVKLRVAAPHGTCARSDVANSWTTRAHI